MLNSYSYLRAYYYYKVYNNCILSKQIKHLAVLFMEQLRTSVENPKETKIQKENHRKFLLSQIRTLVNNWIIKFDPLKQNTTSKDDGLEFLKMSDGEFIAQYTNSIVKEDNERGSPKLGAPLFAMGANRRQSNQSSTPTKVNNKKKIGMKSNRNGHEKDMLATQSHSLNQNSLWNNSLFRDTLGTEGFRILGSVTADFLHFYSICIIKRKDELNSVEAVVETYSDKPIQFCILWQSQEINLHNESLQEQSQFSYKGNHSLHNIDQHMKTTTSKFIVGQHNPALLDKFLGHRGTFTVTTSPLGMRKTSRHTLAVGQSVDASAERHKARMASSNGQDGGVDSNGVQWKQKKITNIDLLPPLQGGKV